MIDKEVWNEWFVNLQMAFRVQCGDPIAEFYLEFINREVGPDNGQWQRACRTLILAGGQRMPSLGDIIKMIQVIMTEDDNAKNQAERRAEMLSLSEEKNRREIKLVHNLAKSIDANALTEAMKDHLGNVIEDGIWGNKPF